MVNSKKETTLPLKAAWTQRIFMQTRPCAQRTIKISWIWTNLFSMPKQVTVRLTYGRIAVAKFLNKFGGRGRKGLAWNRKRTNEMLTFLFIHLFKPEYSKSRISGPFGIISKQSCMQPALLVLRGIISTTRKKTVQGHKTQNRVQETFIGRQKQGT